jgi:hypothetical protein
MTRNQTMLAVALEVAPGTLFQTFGVGIMLSYWFLQAINAALTTIWIGFLTGPLTYLAYMVLAPTNLLQDGRRR